MTSDRVRRGLSPLRDAAKFQLSLSRSLRTFQVLDGRPRPTSFPFISGDTYRSLADRYFDLEFWKRFQSGSRVMPGVSTEARSVVFVECILLRSQAVEAELCRWVDSLPEGNQLAVVFANGDEPPRESLRKALVSRRHTVYSHNVHDGENGVVPIPLGLQNATHQKFGVVDDFLLFYDELRNPPVRPRIRDIRIYGNFSVSSNPTTRAPLKQMLTQSRFGFVEKPLSVRENRAQMLRAQFVPSPAGLGPDCYRTWEALYLGAIPVVIAGTVAESITNDLPIWVVEDWDELVGASDNELDEKFATLSARPRNKAMFPYWQSRILGEKAGL